MIIDITKFEANNKANNVTICVMNVYDIIYSSFLRKKRIIHNLESLTLPRIYRTLESYPNIFV